MATARTVLDQTATGELSSRSEDAAEVVDRSAQASDRWLDAGASLTWLWLDAAHAQLTHNFETLQRLLDCRDWHSLGTLQQAFVQESMRRLDEACARQRELMGELITRLLARRDTETKIEA